MGSGYDDCYLCGKRLPSDVYALPSTYIAKCAPIRRRGEVRYIEDNDGGISFGFPNRDRTLIRYDKKSFGDRLVFKLSAMGLGGCSLAAYGLLVKLYFMWHSGGVPNFISDKDGGYGCFEFVPDDCKPYFGGMKWARVKKLFCEFPDLIKLEKLKKGRWRVLFLVERRNSMIYDDSEKEARAFGSDFKYLELRELDIKKKAMLYFESKRNAKQASTDRDGGEKSGDYDFSIDGL